MKHPALSYHGGFPPAARISKRSLCRFFGLSFCPSADRQLPLSHVSFFSSDPVSARFPLHNAGVVFPWFFLSPRRTARLAVCVSVLDQIHDSMEPADRKNKDKIEAAIDTFCGQRLSSRDDKMVSLK